MEVDAKEARTAWDVLIPPRSKAGKMADIA
jgi:hypothetical protein